MDQKKEIITKFEEKVKEEIENLDNIDNEKERYIRLDTLYKIHKYLVNFDELEPVLNKFFEDRKNKEKWER